MKRSPQIRFEVNDDAYLVRGFRLLAVAPIQVLRHFEARESPTSDMIQPTEAILVDNRPGIRRRFESCLGIS